MKRQRPPTLVEFDEEDESDEFKPLFDYSETLSPAPTFLSDESDEDDVIITSGPPQLKHPKISPAKEPPTPTVTLDDEDEDDESWLMPSPTKFAPKLPSPGNPTLQQLRLKRMELMMLQQNASPEAIRRVEEQARMQAQKRPEVVKTPVHEESQAAAASQGKEKILIKVQDKAGDILPFRIFTTDKFEKLFRVYADVSHVPLANVSFRFDGEQLSANSTPKEHDMEDGELIEVYHKS